MSAQRVLVAFASRSGSTAGIAEAIAAVLGESGLPVECCPAGDIVDVTPYDAVVLGSGVFLRRRGSDGGGFLIRHEVVLRTRAVWLFCAGPIGRGRSESGVGPEGSGVGPEGSGAGPEGSDDSSVTEVANAVGARGCAVFGTPAPATDDPHLERASADMTRVRAWAREIAADLAEHPVAVRPPAPEPAARARRRERCSRAVTTG